MSWEQKTVEEAQDWILENMDEGTECPCCEQTVKLYKRKIDTAMAYILVNMHLWDQREDTNEWIHVPKFLEKLKGLRNDLRGGDYAKMRFWGLIEPRPEVRDDGSLRAGWWRMTEAGNDFARGIISVPRFAYVYNNTPVKWSDERTDIFRSLGDKFNYAEIMGASQP